MDTGAHVGGRQAAARDRRVTKVNVGCREFTSPRSRGLSPAQKGVYSSRGHFSRVFCNSRRPWLRDVYSTWGTLARAKSVEPWCKAICTKNLRPTLALPPRLSP